MKREKLKVPNRLKRMNNIGRQSRKKTGMETEVKLINSGTGVVFNFSGTGALAGIGNWMVVLNGSKLKIRRSGTFNHGRSGTI